MEDRLHNILYFTIIFLSGDLNLLHQSPDYILEKFHFYFGEKIIIKEHEECGFYKKYKKIWRIDDYRINSIFLFLLNVVNYERKNVREDIDPFGEEDWDDIDDTDIENIAIYPDDYFYLFDKWIGDIDDTLTIKKYGIHRILKMKMYDVYKNIFIK